MQVAHVGTEPFQVGVDDVLPELSIGFEVPFISAVVIVVLPVEAMKFEWLGDALQFEQALFAIKGYRPIGRVCALVAFEGHEEGVLQFRILHVFRSFLAKGDAAFFKEV
jgi:hypothetical protein